MLLRRRRVLGTAMAVGATASMVSGARRNMAQRKAYDQQIDATEAANQAAMMQAQQAPVTAASDAADDPLTQQIKQLNDLRVAGLITTEEYEAKKKQILNL